MILKFINTMLIVSIALGLSSVGITLAQQESWQKIAPVGQSFTILMPTQATEVSRLIPLDDKDSIPERVYYSLASGKRYMVASFVKTSADRVPALSTFDNFMHAIEQGFKSSEGETRSLTFDDNISGKGD
jgi:hypothetical protein